MKRSQTKAEWALLKDAKTVTADVKHLIGIKTSLKDVEGLMIMVEAVGPSIVQNSCT